MVCVKPIQFIRQVNAAGCEHPVFLLIVRDVLHTQTHAPGVSDVASFQFQPILSLSTSDGFTQVIFGSFANLR